jgi:hypothetical protein
MFVGLSQYNRIRFMLPSFMIEIKEIEIIFIYILRWTERQKFNLSSVVVLVDDQIS